MSQRNAVRRGRLVVPLAAAVAFAACDIEGTQQDQATIGPALRIVSNSIDEAEGVVPSDGVIQLAFDRYLLPSTITRQSYAIADNTNTVLANVAPKTTYDPVARTVTISGPDGPGQAWLIPEQVYKLVLPIPQDPRSDIGGFRAIDRATLHPDEKRAFVFRAGPPRHQTRLEPRVDFCADVVPIFITKCSSSTCHGPSTLAASGLVLGSAEGVRVTAKGRVAAGANTGARSGTPEPTPRRFGLNMALIQPGDPGSSWLLYKVELAPPPMADVETPPTVVCMPPTEARPIPSPAPDYHPLVPARTNVDDGERQILNRFVLGREMPYPTRPAGHETETVDGSAASYFSAPLSFQERERVRLWIAQGAALRECGTCRVETLNASAPPTGD